MLALVLKHVVLALLMFSYTWSAHSPLCSQSQLHGMSLFISVIVCWIYRACHFIREQVKRLFWVLEETLDFWVVMKQKPMRNSGLKWIYFCSMGWPGCNVMIWSDALSDKGHVGQPIFIFNLTGLESPTHLWVFGECFQIQPPSNKIFIYINLLAKEDK